MTDAPDSRDEALSHVVDLPDPPAKLWRALTEPALIARWLAGNDMRSASAPGEAGGRFTLKTPLSGAGDVTCEVLDAEPPRLLRWRWRDIDESTGAQFDSVVSFTIAERPDGGARLTITHQGVAANAVRAETPAAVARLAPLRRLPRARRIVRAIASPPKMRCVA